MPYVHPLYHWPPKSNWMAPLSPARRWSTMAAYVHFPFCRNICDFCGYETRLIKDRLAGAYPSHAKAHVEWHVARDDFTGASLQSVFFGGGTASLIPERAFRSILDALRLLGQSATEVTLECEPGTITSRRLRSARIAGVNRVSVGAQSLSDERLKRVGRIHTARDAVRLVYASADAGIENVHVDLMYGLPEQSLVEWEHTVQQAAKLPITHVSIYKLYVFLFGALDRGKVMPRPDRENPEHTSALRRMYDVGCAVLGESGFEQYSLTEFARPGWQSRYIHACFNGDDLLPIGPGAFGRCGNELWENAPYVHHYVTQDSFEKARAYHLTAVDAFKRDVILGLWLLYVDMKSVARRSRVRASQQLIELLTSLADRDQLHFKESKLRLAPHQRFHAGQLMKELADLPASHWAEPDDMSNHPDCDPMQEIGSRNVLPAKLATLFRTARRDKQLFQQLKAEPVAILQECCSELTSEQLKIAATAIVGADGAPSDLLEQVRQTWADVVNEYD